MAAALSVSKLDRRQQRQQFAQQVDTLSSTLQQSIDRHSELLRSLTALYHVFGSISETEFKTFMRPYLEVYPGIQSLEWAPVIAAEERSEFEASMRNRGYDSFQILETDADGDLVKASPREIYIPITYSASWQDSQAAHGFDLGSSETRRQALDAARDSQAVVASEQISLEQGTEQELEYLMLLPIFPAAIKPDIRDSGQLDPALAESESPNGYLLGVLGIANLVEESLANLNANIDFSISDRSAEPDREFLGTYQATRGTLSKLQPQTTDPSDTYLCPTPNSCIRGITVGGREWSIAFTPAESYPLSPISWKAVSVLVSGLLVTAGLLFHFWRSQSILERLQDTNEFKLRFFSQASRELRPHLSTVLMGIKFLATNRDRLSSDQQDSLIQRIQTTTKEISQLTDDILTLVRAETGKLEFAPRLLNLDAYCEELVGQLRLELKRRTIFYENLDNVELAYVDPKLLRIVLFNLLSNAVKYSSVKSIVHITLNQIDERVVIQVSDSGIGIPKPTRLNLFDSFVRGENVGKIPGTGLGLSLAKTCVELHGGTISIDSELNVGTMATVHLPLVD